MSGTFDLVHAIAFSGAVLAFATAPGCVASSSGGSSGSGKGSSSGSSSGSGGETDSGSGSGSAGEAASHDLCSMYGVGDPHRATFGLAQPKQLSGSMYGIEMIRLAIDSQGNKGADFLVIGVTTGASEIGALPREETYDDIPDVGMTGFELCQASDSSCAYSNTGATGDANCSTVLAASRTWQ